MRNLTNKKNKGIAFYFTLEEIAKIDEYCEKYLSNRIVFVKAIIERFIKEEKLKINSNES
ncbi:hypothetical protein [Campylobacter vicugnae]|uniref:hypothetical protein n=1 Tax=Campylobacter vicugnae TaxID=1660076 RepID=UPI000A340675|nr:hypothetical protein [Campylobacter sp. S0112]